MHKIQSSVSRSIGIQKRKLLIASDCQTSLPLEDDGEEQNASTTALFLPNESSVVNISMTKNRNILKVSNSSFSISQFTMFVCLVSVFDVM